jgi:hypothetical protein
MENFTFLGLEKTELALLSADLDDAEFLQVL